MITIAVAVMITTVLAVAWATALEREVEERAHRLARARVKFLRRNRADITRALVRRPPRPYRRDTHGTWREER